MALTKPSWTDPATGAVYPNVYLRALPPVFDPDMNDGNGEAMLTVIGYASRAARTAKKNPLFRTQIRLTKGVTNADGTVSLDTSDVAKVIGAPVGGAQAMARYNALMKAAYDWLKDPVNANRVGFDLSDATDDGA